MHTILGVPRAKMTENNQKIIAIGSEYMDAQETPSSASLNRRVNEDD